MKTALITGITGQDGSYLAELLLSKKYQVVGMVSKIYNIGWGNIKQIREKLILKDGDLLDENSLKKIFAVHKPDEVYNLGGITFIPTAWEKPQLTFDVNALGTLRILEILKNKYPKVRFYQASSAKMFGNPQVFPQNENTPIEPLDPYSISKACAHFLVGAYRKNFSLFTVSGIMYNHESIRRGPEFVTRKITRGAVKIKLGLAKKLRLGNLQAAQDWGWAPDYVKAMWLMLQQENPGDFVIATGKLHTVEDVCRIAFSSLDLDYKDFVISDKIFARFEEGTKPYGDSGKAKKLLNWYPSVSFKQMIELMVETDWKVLQKGETK